MEPREILERKVRLDKYLYVPDGATFRLELRPEKIEDLSIIAKEFQKSYNDLLYVKLIWRKTDLVTSEFRNIENIMEKVVEISEIPFQLSKEQRQQQQQLTPDQQVAVDTFVERYTRIEVASATHEKVSKTYSLVVLPHDGRRKFDIQLNGIVIDRQDIFVPTKVQIDVKRVGENIKLEVPDFPSSLDTINLTKKHVWIKVDLPYEDNYVYLLDKIREKARALDNQYPPQANNVPQEAKTLEGKRRFVNQNAVVFTDLSTNRDLSILFERAFFYDTGKMNNNNEFAAFSARSAVNMFANPRNLSPYAFLKQQIERASQLFVINLTGGNQDRVAQELWSYIVKVYLNSNFGMPGRKEFTILGKGPSSIILDNLTTEDSGRYLCYQYGICDKFTTMQEYPAMAFTRSVGSENILTFRGLFSLAVFGEIVDIKKPSICFSAGQITNFEDFVSPDFGDQRGDLGIARGSIMAGTEARRWKRIGHIEKSRTVWDIRGLGDVVNISQDVSNNGFFVQLYSARQQIDRALRYDVGNYVVPFRIADIDTQYPRTQPRIEYISETELSWAIVPWLNICRVEFVTKLPDIVEEYGKSILLSADKIIGDKRRVREIRWKRITSGSFVELVKVGTMANAMSIGFIADEDTAGDQIIEITGTNGQRFSYEVHLSVTGSCKRCGTKYDEAKNVHGSCTWHTKHIDEIRQKVLRENGRDLMSILRDQDVLRNVKTKLANKQYMKKFNGPNVLFKVSTGQELLSVLPFRALITILEDVWSEMGRHREMNYSTTIQNRLSRIESLIRYLEYRSPVFDKDVLRDVYKKADESLEKNFQVGDKYEKVYHHEGRFDSRKFADLAPLTEIKNIAEIIYSMDEKGQLNLIPREEKMYFRDIDFVFMQGADQTYDPAKLFDPEYDRDIIAGLFSGKVAKNPNTYYGITSNPYDNSQTMWACCGQSVNSEGCWVGRHSAKTTIPDLHDYIRNAPVRGSEHLLFDKTIPDVHRQIVEKFARYQELTELMRENVQIAENSPLDLEKEALMIDIWKLESKINTPLGGVISPQLEFKTEKTQGKRYIDKFMSGMAVPERIFRKILLDIESDKSFYVWSRDPTKYSKDTPREFGVKPIAIKTGFELEKTMEVVDLLKDMKKTKREDKETKVASWLTETIRTRDPTLTVTAARKTNINTRLARLEVRLLDEIVDYRGRPKLPGFNTDLVLSEFQKIRSVIQYHRDLLQKNPAYYQKIGKIIDDLTIQIRELLFRINTEYELAQDQKIMDDAARLTAENKLGFLLTQLTAQGNLGLTKGKANILLENLRSRLKTYEFYRIWFESTFYSEKLPDSFEILNQNPGDTFRNLVEKNMATRGMTDKQRTTLDVLSKKLDTTPSKVSIADAKPFQNEFPLDVLKGHEELIQKWAEESRLYTKLNDAYNYNQTVDGDLMVELVSKKMEGRDSLKKLMQLRGMFKNIYGYKSTGLKLQQLGIFLWSRELGILTPGKKLPKLLKNTKKVEPTIADILSIRDGDMLVLANAFDWTDIKNYYDDKVNELLTKGEEIDKLLDNYFVKVVQPSLEKVVDELGTEYKIPNNVVALVIQNYVLGIRDYNSWRVMNSVVPTADFFKWYYGVKNIQQPDPDKGDVTKGFTDASKATDFLQSVKDALGREIEITPQFTNDIPSLNFIMKIIELANYEGNLMTAYFGETRSATTTTLYASELEKEINSILWLQGFRFIDSNPSGQKVQKIQQSQSGLFQTTYYDFMMFWASDIADKWRKDLVSPTAVQETLVKGANKYVSDVIDRIETSAVHVLEVLKRRFFAKVNEGRVKSPDRLSDYYDANSATIADGSDVLVKTAQPKALTHFLSFINDDPDAIKWMQTETELRVLKEAYGLDNMNGGIFFDPFYVVLLMYGCASEKNKPEDWFVGQFDISLQKNAEDLFKLIQVTRAKWKSTGELGLDPKKGYIDYILQKYANPSKENNVQANIVEEHIFEVISSYGALIKIYGQHFDALYKPKIILDQYTPSTEISSITNSVKQAVLKFNPATRMLGNLLINASLSAVSKPNSIEHRTIFLSGDDYRDIQTRDKYGSMVSQNTSSVISDKIVSYFLTTGLLNLSKTRSQKTGILLCNSDMKKFGVLLLDVTSGAGQQRDYTYQNYEIEFETYNFTLLFGNTNVSVTGLSDLVGEIQNIGELIYAIIPNIYGVHFLFRDADANIVKLREQTLETFKTQMEYIDAETDKLYQQLIDELDLGKFLFSGDDLNELFNDITRRYEKKMTSNDRRYVLQQEKYIKEIYELFGKMDDFFRQYQRKISKVSTLNEPPKYKKLDYDALAKAGTLVASAKAFSDRVTIIPSAKDRFKNFYIKKAKGKNLEDILKNLKNVTDNLPPEIPDPTLNNTYLYLAFMAQESGLDATNFEKYIGDFYTQVNQVVPISAMSLARYMYDSRRYGDLDQLVCLTQITYLMYITTGIAGNEPWKAPRQKITGNYEDSPFVHILLNWDNYGEIIISEFKLAVKYIDFIEEMRNYYKHYENDFPEYDEYSEEMKRAYYMPKSELYAQIKTISQKDIETYFDPSQMTQRMTLINAKGKTPMSIDATYTYTLNTQYEFELLLSPEYILDKTQAFLTEKTIIKQSQDVVIKVLEKMLPFNNPKFKQNGDWVIPVDGTYESDDPAKLPFKPDGLSNDDLYYFYVSAAFTSSMFLSISSASTEPILYDTVLKLYTWQQDSALLFLSSQVPSPFMDEVRKRTDMRMLDAICNSDTEDDLKTKAKAKTAKWLSDIKSGSYDTKLLYDLSSPKDSADSLANQSSGIDTIASDMEKAYGPAFAEQRANYKDQSIVVSQYLKDFWNTGDWNPDLSLLKVYFDDNPKPIKRTKFNKYKTKLGKTGKSLTWDKFVEYLVTLALPYVIDDNIEKFIELWTERALRSQMYFGRYEHEFINMTKKFSFRGGTNWKKMISDNERKGEYYIQNAETPVLPFPIQLCCVVKKVPIGGQNRYSMTGFSLWNPLPFNHTNIGKIFGRGWPADKENEKLNLSELVIICNGDEKGTYTNIEQKKSAGNVLTFVPHMFYRHSENSTGSVVKPAAVPNVHLDPSEKNQIAFHRQLPLGLLRYYDKLGFSPTYDITEGIYTDKDEYLYAGLLDNPDPNPLGLPKILPDEPWSEVIQYYFSDRDLSRGVTVYQEYDRDDTAAGNLVRISDEAKHISELETSSGLAMDFFVPEARYSYLEYKKGTWEYDQRENNSNLLKALENNGRVLITSNINPKVISPMSQFLNSLKLLANDHVSK